MRFLPLVLLLMAVGCKTAAPAKKETEKGALRVISVSAVAAPSVPVTDATNLSGVYIVGRGAQVFSWTQPLLPDQTVDTSISGYRLYWWRSGGATNSVDLPKTAQKVLMSGVAGGSKPLTFVSMSALNGVVEGVPSNLLLIPTEP
jgi:hypothetical protein